MSVSTIDSAVRRSVLTVQEYTLLSIRTFREIFRRPFNLSDIVLQADSIGVGSLPTVILTGFFLGGILALQSASMLTQFGATAFTGQLVSFSMIREIGPVVTALMVSGRNASGIASELGSMIVTEQIDAMRALGTDPVKKLVVPRLVATIIMMFFLVILSDSVGIVGGGLVSVFMLGQDGSQYFHTAYQSLQYPDVLQGLVKPVVFGFIVASIGCFCGMKTRSGTQGVGRSTTRAVVFSSVLIIASDFLISRFLVGIFNR